MAYADTIRTTTFTASDIANLIDGLLTAQINGAYLYAGVSGGSANAQTGSLTQSPGSYTSGICISFKSGFTNSGSATFNLNSLGAVTIFDSRTGIALVGNEIFLGGVYYLEYVGSNFYLMNGSPALATWAASPNGFSVSPASAVYRYILIGKSCTISVYQPNDGTSNATTFTISLPFTAATIAGMVWYVFCPVARDNSADKATAVARITSGGTVVEIFPSMGLGAWTAGGGKRVIFQMTYEIA